MMVDMIGEYTHITHYEFRSWKNPCIDTLQDKVIILSGIQRYQKSVINIPITQLANIYDPAVRFELLCYGREIIH
jgi:hypothetical protein